MNVIYMKEKKVNNHEILAPVGNMDAFYAAIEGGADAVYLAGKMFGARAYSNNFTNSELKEIIKYAHLYNVKVYVTCNILIFEREVDKFIEFVRFLHQNNVDAIIMQDIGMIDLVHKKFPNLEIHGSTQMHIHNLEGAKFAEKLGLKRIVLARETPLSEIKKIKENTNLEIEVFVHGALCVSYSGMCLFARSIGPRSGNRGTCSGCCRLPYELLSENENVLNQNKYPLSMKDLMTINYLDKLIDSGIDSFKIEGRMKSKEYVYLATKLYKETKDNYLKNNKLDINQELITNLNNVFTRGYTNGFILNSNDLVNDFAPNHKGVLIGRVINYKNNFIEIKLNTNISIHDGLRIINNNLEYGFILNEFYKDNKLIKEAKENDIIKIKVNKNIPINSLVYRTYSYLIDNNITNIIKNKERRINIKFKINIKKDKKVSLIVSDYLNEFEMKGDIPSISINKPITEYDIKSKLEKINDTIYKLNEIEINLDNDLFIPISMINNLKRNILNKLDELRINKYEKEFIEKEYSIKLENYPKVSCYTLYTDDIKYIDKKYKYIYSSNINDYIKKIPKVINNYNIYDKKKEYLVSEIGSLNYFDNIISDYSLNVTNSYSVAFLHSIGVKRVTLSVELLDNDIKELIDNYKIRYNKLPNLELIKETNLEVMVIKNNLGKYGNVYYLKDRFNNKYRVIKKNDLYYIYDYKRYIRKENDDYYFNIGINYLRDEYYY